MAFGRRRKKTTVEKTKSLFTLNKLVKFSYLQSIAIEQGLGSAEQFAGESEESEFTSTDSNIVKDKFSKFVGKKADILGRVLGPAAGAGAEVLSFLFGKKVKTSISHTVKESGWRVAKIWKQPEFDRIRYAIGIKELQVSQFTYQPVSEIISHPWSFPKEIIKVTLLADEFIPTQFEPGQNYIDYYIKPEIEGIDWIRINPLGTRTIFTPAGTIIPRIINFNVERSVSSKLEETFIITKEPVRQLRFRAVLRRPETIAGSSVPASAYSPILKSYRMLGHPRGGL